MSKIKLHTSPGEIHHISPSMEKGPDFKLVPPISFVDGQLKTGTLSEILLLVRVAENFEIAEWDEKENCFIQDTDWEETFSKVAFGRGEIPLDSILENMTARLKKGFFSPNVSKGGLPFVNHLVSSKFFMTPTVLEFIDAWFEAGGDMEKRDWRGRTLLLSSASSGVIKVVERLLSHGADIHAKTDSGKNLLHAMSESTMSFGNPEDKELFFKRLSELLTDNSVKQMLHERDSLGVTPVDLCFNTEFILLRDAFEYERSALKLLVGASGRLSEKSMSYLFPDVLACLQKDMLVASNQKVESRNNKSL